MGKSRRSSVSSLSPCLPFFTWRSRREVHLLSRVLILHAHLSWPHSGPQHLHHPSAMASSTSFLALSRRRRASKRLSSVSPPPQRAPPSSVGDAGTARASLAGSASVQAHRLASPVASTSLSTEDARLPASAFSQSPQSQQQQGSCTPRMSHFLFSRTRDRCSSDASMAEGVPATTGHLSRPSGVPSSSSKRASIGSRLMRSLTSAELVSGRNSHSQGRSESFDTAAAAVAAVAADNAESAHLAVDAANKVSPFLAAATQNLLTTALPGCAGQEVNLVLARPFQRAQRPPAERGFRPGNGKGVDLQRAFVRGRSSGRGGAHHSDPGDPARLLRDRRGRDGLRGSKSFLAHEREDEGSFAERWRLDRPLSRDTSRAVGASSMLPR